MQQRPAGERRGAGGRPGFWLTGALAWWAADEVIWGVNPWRRVIGGVGLLFFAMRLIGR